VELLAVMIIIGIIIALVLTAAQDGIRRAEERATQALITKLETGINDRFDALMQYVPTPNFAHAYLAGVYPGLPWGGTDADGLPIMSPPALLSSGLPDTRCLTQSRAQVIATYDYLKSELPDVFIVNPTFLTSGGPYPLNFAGVPFPGTPLDPNNTGLSNFMLPLGHMVTGPRNGLQPTNPAYWPSGFGDSHQDPATFFLVSTHPELGYSGSGIYGASYPAAAGIYKNLGYLPQGYDGVDNGGINGLIDDWAEGVNPTNSAQVMANIRAHKHITARSEMLYALLVEGQGPLGSIFNRDDFTDKEVQDTDGDGLPEFVDAWGQPLQFFRWPLFYHSDTQRGQVTLSDPNTGAPTLQPPYIGPQPNGPYGGPYDAREQDPLDPNQQLVAPAWWSSGGNLANPNSPFVQLLAQPPYLENASAVGASGGVIAFENFLHRLTEPLTLTATPTWYWDRSASARRAFFTKPLIISAGPDKLPGVYIYPETQLPNVQQLIFVENNAMTFINEFTLGASYTIPVGTAIVTDNYSYSASQLTSSYALQQAGQDDISNHNVVSAIGIGG
jgi:hypothetical protein